MGCPRRTSVLHEDGISEVLETSGPEDFLLAGPAALEAFLREYSDRDERRTLRRRCPSIVLLTKRHFALGSGRDPGKLTRSDPCHRDSTTRSSGWILGDRFSLFIHQTTGERKAFEQAKRSAPSL